MYRNVLISTTYTVLTILLFVTSAAAQPCTDKDLDGYSMEGGLCGLIDCDDNDRTVYPQAAKLCDAKDNNCDGRLDFSTDVDKDGDGVPLCADDCNDRNRHISPLAQEGPHGSTTCSDRIDNDCDNRIDMADEQCKPCTDNDGDGFGNPGLIICDNGPLTDCNDNDPGIHPDAVDNSCNNIDENCDGYIDNGYVNGITACGQGICSSTGLLICSDGVEIDTCSPGAVLSEGPVGDPTCYDTVDNDCDGVTDSNDTNCIGPCIDNDGDGYGSPGNINCPQGTVIDCNDNDADINPGVPDDTCNNVDENCDGYYDEGYIITVTGCGQGICSSSGLLICSGGVETDTCSPDTMQSEGPVGDPTCYDTVDNDCDGVTDSNDTDCAGPCIDNDGDGYGSPGNINCPQGAVIDCNDQDSAISAHNISYCDPSTNSCDSVYLTWTAPMNNVDGSVLSDLAGYKIYFGEYSNMYADTIDIGNSTCFKMYIQSQGQSCFAVTSYDIAGNESVYSNEVCYFIN